MVDHHHRLKKPERLFTTIDSLRSENSQPKLSEREIAEAWAKITIIKWKKKLASNKNGDTGNLLKSFKYNVLATARGNVMKITLLFEYYGRFVDMGVGRGVKIGDVKESATSWKHLIWPALPNPLYNILFLIV